MKAGLARRETVRRHRVARGSGTSWIVSLLLIFGSAASAVPLLHSTALAQQPASKESWASSFSSEVKKSFDKMGRLVSPKSPPSPTRREDDPISLNTPAKPGANLYVAFARLARESGKLPEAEQQYQLALKEDPTFLPALLGMAELQEQMGHPNEAIQWYERTIRAHPRQASAFNNMGLCYARLGRQDEAVTAISRAIQLAPKNPLYRNNLAAALVEQGRTHEAFTHLSAVHTEAAAYYNLGYLLNKKGQTRAALQHFAWALRVDPSMEPAQRWINYLQQETAQARLPGHPAAAGMRITSETMQQAANPPTYGQPSTPTESNAAVGNGNPTPMATQREMPYRMRTAPSRDSLDGSLPGIAYDGSPTPTAPLPPPIRPLPRVED